MRRNIRQYRRLGRSKAFSRQPLANHWYSALATGTLAHQAKLQPIVQYLPSAIWNWVTYVARYLFEPKHPFPGADRAPNNSKYAVDDVLRVSVAGDWGTGTEEAAAVATEMMKWEGGGEPDLTIHLGDVYYVGGKHEVDQNCLGQADPKTQFQGVRWPGGRQGSFALNGNHEMYAKGYAYFDVMLPTLGKKPAQPKGQGASFFCLENKHWRIVAVDTGYNSATLIFKPNCKLPDPLIAWLDTQFPGGHDKATVLLSHHQYYSAFEDSYPVPARQLSRYFGKSPVLWIWGHEHRLAAYHLHKLDGVNLSVYGRCLGHGGMPVEANPPATDEKHRAAKEKLLFSDQRVNPFYANDKEVPPIGINGFSQLFFDGPTLTIWHKTLVCAPASPDGPSYPSSSVLLTERFRCDGPRIEWLGLGTPHSTAKGLYVDPHWENHARPNASASAKEQPDTTVNT